MRNYKLIYVSVLILSALTAGKAQDTLHFTVEEAAIFALENSTSTNKAVLNEAESEQQIREVRSQALPQLDAVGTFDDNLNIPVQLIPGEIFGEPGTTVEAQFGQQYVASGSVKLNQAVFDRSVITGLRAAKTGREYYSLQTRQAREEKVYEVYDNYFNIVITQEQLKILLANRDRIESLLDISRSQYAAGIIKKIDLSRIEVNMTNIQTDINRLQSRLNSQKNALKYAMGLDIAQPILLEDTMEAIRTDYLADLPVESDYIESRTEFQIVKKSQELNLLEIDNYKSGYYPRMSAYLQHGYNAQRNQFDFFDGSQPWFETTVVGVQLNVPIFSGFRRNAQVQQSKIRLDKLKVDQQDVERAINLEYSNAQSELENSRQSSLAQQENVQLAQEVYDVTEETYQSGIAPLTDLLNAETDLIEAQSNFTESVLAFKVSQLKLLKASGQLMSLIDTTIQE